MTSEVCHEALESIIDGLSGAAFDNDRDLTRNKLFQLIKVNYRSIFDTAKKGRHYILLIPPISAINQVRIDENVIEAHILQKNIKRNDYKTLGGQSVVLQNGSFHIDAGQESPHTSVQVIDEELFYTDDSKCIKVIHTNKPILGKVEHGSVPLDESNPFSKLPKNASLSDYTIFLRSFPENESVLEKLDEYVEDFNANYKMSAGTEGQIWKRVKSIWIDIVKSLVYVNPVFSTCQENSHHSNELKLAVECYLMNGIYNSIFDGLCTIHANEDVDLMDSLSAFSRVPNKEMLEVMFKYRSDFSSSVEELNSMIHLFTPIEKLRCLRKCIKQLYRTISQSQSQSSLQGHIRKTGNSSHNRQVELSLRRSVQCMM